MVPTRRNSDVVPLKQVIAGLISWKGIDARTRTYRGICLAFLGLIVVIGPAYRSWSWSRHIRDFGLADAWTNIWAVPAMVYAETGFMGASSQSIYKSLTAAVGGLLLWEATQLTGLLGFVFDWADIAGTLVGIAPTLVIHRCVQRATESRGNR